MADFKLMPMTMRHYEPVYALWQASPGIVLTRSDSRERIEAFLRRNPGLSHVAMVQEKLVGAVLCGHDGRRGYLHHLAVAAAYRGRGIGRALVEICLRRLREQGIEKCHIFVMQDNPEGIAFWERIGWIDRTELKIMSYVLQ